MAQKAAEAAECHKDIAGCNGAVKHFPYTGSHYNNPALRSLRRKDFCCFLDIDGFGRVLQHEKL